ncbi:uncharacterized protein LOC122577465, partial [Bombus pyrosoma]|uniref:uncharacterized protein LOC122577465 n=1 Tax=Bombus pyrosoma TaxID=396416 RepID=UPI001CB98328
MPVGTFKARGNVSLLKMCLRAKELSVLMPMVPFKPRVLLSGVPLEPSFGCRLCWLWTWKYLRLPNLYNTRGGEIPKMCGWLVKTIQMTVRRLTSLRRLLLESWMFSCVTALLVGAIFSTVLVIMILNGEYGRVFIKGSLCRLS